MIDWFTVIAQIVNFLILVALLKHFLYGPIQRAMAKRQERIEQNWHDAEQARQQAEQQQATLEKRQQQLDQHQEQLREQAKQDVETQREQWLEQARHAVDQQRHQWLEALSQERRQFDRQLSRAVGKTGLAVSAELLRQLADLDLEKALVEKMTVRLANLPPDVRGALEKAAADSGGDLQVVSRFELDQPAKQQLTHQLQQLLGPTAQVAFAVDDAILAGLQVQASGYQLDWNLQAYLDRLSDQFDRKLQELHQQHADEDGDHES